MMCEFLDGLNNVKNNKAGAAVEVMVPAEFYKKSCRLFTRSLERGEIEEYFRRSLIFPISKNGNPADVTNYQSSVFVAIMNE